MNEANASTENPRLVGDFDLGTHLRGRLTHGADRRSWKDDGWWPNLPP
ncbi:hypothetical protein [Mesorhizobium sp. M1403]